MQYFNTFMIAFYERNYIRVVFTVSGILKNFRSIKLEYQSFTFELIYISDITLLAF